MTGGVMDSGLRRHVKGRVGCGGLSHAFSVELEAMGIVNEAVEDGIR